MAAHLKNPIASNVTDKVTIPIKAKAASQMSAKAAAASLNVIVPSRSEAIAPIPAAKPRLIPRGRLIIK